jgi:uncharacterized protein (TIRG00374 family)
MNKFEEILSPQTKEKEKRKPYKILFTIKVLVSALLIYWILRGINFNEIAKSIENIDFLLLFTALSLHFIGFFLSAERWKLLLKAQGTEAKTSYLISSYLVSKFFNNLLPSTIGGDAIRAYDSYRIGKSKSEALAVIFVDRFLGLFMLLIFALIAFFILQEAASGGTHLILWIMAGLLLFLLIGWLIFSPPKKLRAFANNISIPFSSKLQMIVEKMSGAFWTFRDKKEVLLKALGLSLLLQTNVIIYYFVVSSALNLSVPLYNFFLIIPLSLFIMMLPVTINGIGLRENIFYYFFSTFDITRAEAIAFAWIEYGVIIILGVLGGIVYALRK